MRLQPHHAARVVNVDTPKVEELFGDPRAKSYAMEADSFFGSSWTDCDCAACVRRHEQLMEMYDQR